MNMENVGLSPEQTQLYNLLVKANQEQTEEIKSQIQQSVITKIESVTREVNYLKTKYLNLERKSRKNNVVIFGLQNIVQTQDLLKTTLTQINNLLATNIREEHINNIYRLGKHEKSPIVIEFISFMKKLTLFQDKKKLKNLKEFGVSLANDLCAEDRQELNVLRSHLKIARSQNYDAKIKGLKLWINNIPYTVEELKNIEKNTEQEDNSEDCISIVEDEEEILEEDQSKPVSKETAPTIQPNTSKGIIKGKSDNRPLVERKTTKITKRKKQKVYHYSPIKTRNNSGH